MDVERPTADTGTDLEATAQLPVRVCPRCPVHSQTTGNLCPDCAASYNRRGSRSNISKRLRLPWLP